MHHFYFFNGLFNVSVQLSCMWEDVRWLRQSMQVSMSSSSTLQARHKMLTAASQLQVRKITLQVRRCFEKNCGQEVTSSSSPLPSLPPSLLPYRRACWELTTWAAFTTSPSRTGTATCCW